MRILKLDETTKRNVLEDLLKRSPNQYTEYENRVAVILNEVKARKDEAVFEFTNIMFPPPFLVIRFAAYSERQ